MHNGEDSGPREAPKLVAGHYLQICHPRVEGPQHRALVDNSEDPCNTSTALAPSFGMAPIQKLFLPMDGGMKHMKFPVIGGGEVTRHHR